MQLKDKHIGIVSYGTALPDFVLPASEIEHAQHKVGDGIPQSLGVRQKTLPDIDEDTATLATQASFEALSRWGQDTTQVQALFIGSESHPYAVKPTGTIVKQALGLSETMALADLQFACKAGTQALQIGMSYVGSGLVPAALAVGADTAQSRPGDVLEFTAGAGAAAYIVGSENVLAKVIATTSIATDTPDFWRRPSQPYPEHAGRFSGEPAYFYHVCTATKNLLAETGLQPSDFAYCVFHTPNAKFPVAVAQQLGFSKEQLAPSLIVKEIGNTYAGASLLALAAVLDQAAAGQKILVTSYGSGSGSDSFVLETTPELPRQRRMWSNGITEKIKRLEPVTYQTYHNYTAGGH